MITSETKRVLLESANFDAGSIRRTSRRLGLRSEAVTLVPACGAGLTSIFFHAVLTSRFVVGYTNIDVNGYINLTLADNQNLSALILNSDSATLPYQFTYLNFFLEQTGLGVVTLPVNTVPNAVDGISSGDSPLTTLDNQAIVLHGYNHNSGDWQGGDPANTLTVDVFYTVIRV